MNSRLLQASSTGELLALSRRILTELRRRDVLRTGNAPAGDYAELLVQQATNGELAPNAQRSWDVLTPAGEHLQVKARIVTNRHKRGERQLSVFRSWDFDAAVVVLFDDDFRVWRAARLPTEVVRSAGHYREYVRGNVVFATDELLVLGDDWTPLLKRVEV
jgi:hypothetical protein